MSDSLKPHRVHRLRKCGPITIGQGRIEYRSWKRFAIRDCDSTTWNKPTVLNATESLMSIAGFHSHSLWGYCTSTGSGREPGQSILVLVQNTGLSPVDLVKYLNSTGVGDFERTILCDIRPTARLSIGVSGLLLRPGSSWRSKGVHKRFPFPASLETGLAIPLLALFVAARAMAIERLLPIRGRCRYPSIPDVFRALNIGCEVFREDLLSDEQPASSCGPSGMIPEALRWASCKADQGPAT